MNILRQLLDIQLQAERLIQSDADIHEFGMFSSYSEEIKEYLLSTVDEEMILKYVNEIPLLDMNNLELKGTAEGAIAMWVSGLAGYFFREYRIKKAAKEITRDIRAKYGSIEFLMKNYLSN